MLAAVQNAGLSGILKLDVSAPGPFSLDGVANAFSGDPSGVVSGGLFALLGTGLAPRWEDVGLDAGLNVPFDYSGTQVTFDGHAVPVFGIGPGRVSAIAPDGLGAFTTVRVWTNGVPSNEVIMPVVASLPGLLTRSFPTVPFSTDVLDGNVRNQDGTLNDAHHPAAPGSVITVFATGLGSATSLEDSWDDNPVPLYATRVPFQPVPGFITALFYAQLTVPTSAGPVNGKFPLYFSTGSRIGFPLVPSTNQILLYVASPR